MSNVIIQRGSIKVFYGPMFSGKSTCLLNKIQKYEKLGRKVLVVNYAHDNRYSCDAQMVTHDKKSHTATKCFLLSEIEDIYQDYDVVAIDEGQFFLDCAEKCDQYANDGKMVFVAALDATFQRKGFNKIEDMLPIAEKVIKLRGKCARCPGKSSFTARKICSQQVELIGGEEIYEPLCRQCFLQKQEIINNDGDSDKSLEEIESEGVKESCDKILKKRGSNASDNSISTEDPEKMENKSQLSDKIEENSSLQSLSVC